MPASLTSDQIVAAAAMIGLELATNEVEPVRERLQMLLDAAAGFDHLAENTAELDLHFDADWEVTPQ